MPQHYLASYLGIEPESFNRTLEPGHRFRWRSGITAIVSTLQAVEPHRHLGWTGQVMGIRAIHVWSLEPQGKGVIVKTEESFEGWLARLLRPMMQNMLDTSLKTWLGHLKQTAEANPQVS